MKIGVFGTINRDTIRHANGTKKEGWGGILYNIVTLSLLRNPDDEIYPVCNVGKDCFRPIMAILKSLGGVKLNFVRKVAESNNHCFLTYVDDCEKSEILEGGVPPLTHHLSRTLSRDDISPLLNCDILLVNFISGRDIALKTLARFRKRFKGKIYINIHSYTMGKRKDGSRFLRAPSGWPRLFEIGDFIQINRTELALLAGHSNPVDTPTPIKTDLLAIQRIILEYGVSLSKKVILVTDGAAGLASLQVGSASTSHYPSASYQNQGRCGRCHRRRRLLQRRIRCRPISEDELQ